MRMSKKRDRNCPDPALIIRSFICFKETTIMSNNVSEHKAALFLANGCETIEAMFSSAQVFPALRFL